MKSRAPFGARLLAALPPKDAAARRRKKPRSGRNCCGSNKDNAARTCKKLPVASFCASETAETGRIANGREQGDHVGGDRAAKMHAERAAPNGANFPKGKFQKDLILLVGSCCFGCADSRFAEPRTSRKGNGLSLFASCKK